MPGYWLIPLTAQTVRRISEVNPLRETLTIWNHGQHVVILCDDDEPYIDAARVHGMPIYPHSIITLEKEAGDHPDRAWYVYCYAQQNISWFEGMTPPAKRKWI